MKKYLVNNLFTYLKVSGDIVLIPLIFIFAYSVKFKIGWALQNVFSINIGKIYHHAQVEPYINILIIIVIFWLITFYLLGLYREFKGVMPEIDEFVQIIKGVTLGTVELMAFSFIYPNIPESKFVLLYAWFFGILILGFYHFFLFQIQKISLTQGLNAKATLIIGADDVAQDIAEKILLYPTFRLKYIGNLTDIQPEKIHFHLRKKIRILGKITDYQEIIKKYKIKVIYLAETKFDKDYLDDLISFIERNNLELKVISNLSEHFGDMLNNEIFDGNYFEVIRKLQKPNLTILLIKRVVDFFLALFCLIFFSWLFLLISILIKMTSSSGPIFYLQERIGLNNKSFKMWKFRTMMPNAEEQSGPVQTEKEIENRYIPIGKFLRRFSLDELPQLLNIIKGEMSFVGPRPERPFFTAKYEKEIPYYNLRHLMPPGLTGWAQINGRGFLTKRTYHKVKYDLYYIKNWSLIFDFKILLKTILIVLKREEAY